MAEDPFVVWLVPVVLVVVDFRSYRLFAHINQVGPLDVVPGLG